MHYDEKIDKECFKLCDAINRLPGLVTFSSCCGHGRDNFFIGVFPKDVLALVPLLYYLDSCHSGQRGWRVYVRTDCAMSPPFFYVEGPKGQRGYKGASIIADHINEYLKGSEEFEHDDR